MTNSVAAVVVAGGSGTRFGAELPKQFHTLGKYPLYIWCIRDILLVDGIADIVITAPPDYLERMREEIKTYCPDARNISVTAGGATRQASVLNALESLSDRAPHLVLVHDGVRPFAGRQSFVDCLDTLRALGSCTIGLPVSDTIKKVDGQNVLETIDRSSLWSVQTPQGAPYQLLLDCHRQAARRALDVTDDAAILEAYGHKVTIFRGTTRNIKVTAVDDFRTCELLSSLYDCDKGMQP